MNKLKIKPSHSQDQRPGTTAIVSNEEEKLNQMKINLNNNNIFGKRKCQNN